MLYLVSQPGEKPVKYDSKLDEQVETGGPRQIISAALVEVDTPPEGQTGEQAAALAFTKELDKRGSRPSTLIVSPAVEVTIDLSAS